MRAFAVIFAGLHIATCGAIAFFAYFVASYTDFVAPESEEPTGLEWLYGVAAGVAAVGLAEGLAAVLRRAKLAVAAFLAEVLGGTFLLDYALDHSSQSDGRWLLVAAAFWGTGAATMVTAFASRREPVARVPGAR